ncbi:hypothetical protein P885DRAFT_58976 [Corynascus similis CBS 632.67]
MSDNDITAPDGDITMLQVDTVGHLETGFEIEEDYGNRDDYDIPLPPVPRLQFRLAMERDLDVLEKMSDEAAKLDPDSYRGFQKQCRPTGYLLALLRTTKLYTENNFFTCVVAECATDDHPLIPQGTILGYSVWGWVEYLEDDEGGVTVRMGMLPRVFELWDKYLPDCVRPSEYPYYRPRVVQHRVMPESGLRGRRMRSKQPHYWALHDVEWDRRFGSECDIEGQLIRWGCRVADEEQLWLCVLRWPLHRSGEFMVQGFADCEMLPDYLLVDLCGVEQSLRMIRMRREPQSREEIATAGTESVERGRALSSLNDRKDEDLSGSGNSTISEG